MIGSGQKVQPRALSNVSARAANAGDQVFEALRVSSRSRCFLWSHGATKNQLGTGNLSDFLGGGVEERKRAGTTTGSSSDSFFFFLAKFLLSFSSYPIVKESPLFTPLASSSFEYLFLLSAQPCSSPTPFCS